MVQGFLPCGPAVPGLPAAVLAGSHRQGRAELDVGAQERGDVPVGQRQRRVPSLQDTAVTSPPQRAPKVPKPSLPPSSHGAYKPPKAHQHSPAVPLPGPGALPRASDKITASVENSSMIPNVALWPSRRNFHPLPAQPHPTHPHREAPFSGRS